MKKTLVTYARTIYAKPNDIFDDDACFVLIKKPDWLKNITEFVYKDKQGDMVVAHKKDLYVIAKAIGLNTDDENVMRENAERLARIFFRNYAKEHNLKFVKNYYFELEEIVKTKHPVMMIYSPEADVEANALYTESEFLKRVPNANLKNKGWCKALLQSARNGKIVCSYKRVKTVEELLKFEGRRYNKKKRVVYDGGDNFFFAPYSWSYLMNEVLDLINEEYK